MGYLSLTLRSKPNTLTVTLLGLLLCFFLLVGHAHYFAFYFTSDGFHYYSALRNFFEGHGQWEGPAFENILGNHSYITLFVLSPLVAVFETPFVLLVLTVITHFVSAFIIIKLAESFTHGMKFGFLLPKLFGFLYLMYPYVGANLFAGKYLFQPDFLLPPLLLGLVWAAIRFKPRIFLTLTALILLTKEEYVFLYPFMLLWIYLLMRFLKIGSSFWTKKRWRNVCLTYLVCSIISIVILFVFREKNEINHALRTIDFSDFRLDYSILLGVAIVIWPLSALWTLAIIIARKELGRIAILMAIMIVYPLGRVLMNVLIYDDARGTLWGNVIFAPVVILTTLVVVVVVSRLYMSKRLRSLWYIILILTISGLFVKNFSYEPFKMTRAYLRGSIVSKFDYSEVLNLKRSMVESNSEKAYFITSEHLLFPFMERSHVGRDWVLARPLAQRKEIIKGADYIILNKSKDEGVFLKVTSTSHTKKLETKNFILLKRDESGD